VADKPPKDVKSKKSK